MYRLAFYGKWRASLVNDGLIEKYNREHREYVFYPDRYPNGFAEETPTENLLLSTFRFQDVFAGNEKSLMQRVVGKGGSCSLLRKSEEITSTKIVLDRSLTVAESRYHLGVVEASPTTLSFF